MGVASSGRFRFFTGAEVAVAAAAVTAAAGATAAGMAVYQGQQAKKAAEAQAEAVAEQARRDAADAARSREAQVQRQRALLTVAGADLAGQGLALLETTSEIGAIGDTRLALDARNRQAGLMAAGRTATTQSYLTASGQVLGSLGSAGGIYAAGNR